MVNVYTAEEVARHDRVDDLWIVLHGNVYDLTYFVNEHPGGKAILMESAGKDGTEYFNYIGHSVEAMVLRERFKIGELITMDGASADVNKKPNNTDPILKNENSKVDDDDSWENQEPKKQTISPSLLIFIGILTITIYTMIFYIWYK